MKIWEYQPSMMHSKTVLADDRLVIVGSMNLDPLSLNLLEEGSLAVEDEKLRRSWPPRSSATFSTRSGSRPERRRSPASGERWSGRPSVRWERPRAAEARDA